MTTRSLDPSPRVLFRRPWPSCSQACPARRRHETTTSHAAGTAQAACDSLSASTFPARPSWTGEEGLANVNEVCISETVMEAPGIHELVGNRVVSRDYENVKGIGQKMKIHRLAIVPISAS